LLSFNKIKDLAEAQVHYKYDPIFDSKEGEKLLIDTILKNYVVTKTGGPNGPMDPVDPTGPMLPWEPEAPWGPLHTDVTIIVEFPMVKSDNQFIVSLETFIKYVKHIPLLWKFFSDLVQTSDLSDFSEFFSEKSPTFKIPHDTRVSAQIQIHRKAVETYLHFIEHGVIQDTPIVRLARSSYVAEALFDYWYIESVLKLIDMTKITLEQMANMSPSLIGAIVKAYLNYSFVRPMKKKVVTYFECEIVNDFWGSGLPKWVHVQKSEVIYINSKNERYGFNKGIKRFIESKPELAGWIWDSVPRGHFIRLIGCPAKRQAGMKKAVTLEDLAKYCQQLASPINPKTIAMWKDPSVIRAEKKRKDVYNDVEKILCCEHNLLGVAEQELERAKQAFCIKWDKNVAKSAQKSGTKNMLLVAMSSC